MFIDQVQKMFLIEIMKNQSSMSIATFVIDKRVNYVLFPELVKFKLRRFECLEVRPSLTLLKLV